MYFTCFIKKIAIFILFFFGYRFFNGASTLSTDLVSFNDSQTPALKPIKRHLPLAGPGVAGYPHDGGLFS